MKKERVRISDIAEELGISTATVSNVIHGKTKKYPTKPLSMFRSFWKNEDIFQAWQEFCWHRIIPVLLELW